MSTTTISIRLFTHLVRRLRDTNARYNQIAYQCRHTYRPTHHAKRRAYRAGLRIDTSKARGAEVSASYTQSPFPIENEEGNGGMGVLGLSLRGLPEVGVCLSPLELELGDVLFQGPVPGAPRLRPIPLPCDVECCDFFVH